MSLAWNPPYNPWEEILKLMLSSRAIIHLRIERTRWSDIGDRMIAAFAQAGHSHRIEMARGTSTTKVFFTCSATAQEKVQLAIVDDFTAPELNEAGEFNDALKDL